MNIHFKNQELLKQLNKNVIFKIEVGSKFYNLKNESSDIDLFCIYIDSLSNKGTINCNHHLQYNDVENNINYIFCTIEQFVANILNGDSTMNFEVSKTLEFKQAFNDLYLDLYFRNVFIVKSYLGLAKRDLKTIRHKYNGKTASHFVRGLIFAEKTNNNEMVILNDDEINLLKQIKEETKILEIKELNDYENKMFELRNNLEINKIDIVRISEIEKEIGKINIKYSELIYNEIDSKNIFLKYLYFNDLGNN